MDQVDRLIEESLDSSLFLRKLLHLSQITTRAESSACSRQNDGTRPTLARFTHRATKLTTQRRRQRVERGGTIERDDGYGVTHFQLDGFVTHLSNKKGKRLKG